MEKRVEKNNGSRLKRVVITGPESTGKTLLCENLARHYNTFFIPEYAREYILGLKRKYSYEDVLHIANKQVELEFVYAEKANGLLFYDTYLIITKVWLEVVFKMAPEWIDEILKKNKIDMYLLCAPDIPWIPDGVRENGGEMRNVLFKRYIAELERYACKYHIISGEDRFENARMLVDSLPDLK